MIFSSYSFAREYTNSCEIMFHETAFDAKQRHTELSYIGEDGERIFFNPYNSKLHDKGEESVAHDLVFTIKLYDEEIDKFKAAINERVRTRQSDFCTLGACDVINKATGLILPAPIVFFPRNAVFYMLFLRVFNASRVTNVKFIGSVPIYFLGRQMMPVGIAEMAGITFLVHKGYKKLKDAMKEDQDEREGKDVPSDNETKEEKVQRTTDLKEQVEEYHQFEVELDMGDGKIVKKLLNLGIAG